MLSEECARYMLVFRLVLPSSRRQVAQEVLQPLSNPAPCAACSVLVSRNRVACLSTDLQEATFFAALYCFALYLHPVIVVAVLPWSHLQASPPAYTRVRS